MGRNGQFSPRVRLSFKLNLESSRQLEKLHTCLKCNSIRYLILRLSRRDAFAVVGLSGKVLSDGFATEIIPPQVSGLPDRAVCSESRTCTITINNTNENAQYNGYRFHLILLVTLPSNRKSGLATFHAQ